MAIQDILNKILSEPLIKNMRQFIVDGIEQVYKDATFDGNTNMEVLRARGASPTLNDRLDEADNVQTNIVNEMSTKASINYVDAILMDIAKGGPKALFNSLAILKSTHPNGAEGTFLVMDTTFTDGAHSFMWDSANSVWKDLGVYQAAGIANGTVGPEKTTFFDYIAIPLNIINGYLVNNADGSISPSTEWWLSDFIPVVTGSSYSLNIKGNIQFYNSNKIWINYYGSVENASFLIPSGITFIRITQTIASRTKTPILVKGITVMNEDEAHPKIKEMALGETSGSKLKEKTVDLSKLIVAKEGVNLINPAKIVDGYVLLGATTGQVSDFGGNSYLNEYIKVTPSENLVVSFKTFNYAFYDVSKKYISGANSQQPGTIITTPVNGYFLRIGTSTPNVSGIQLTRGSIEKTYQKYIGFQIPSSYIADDEDKASIGWAGKKLGVLGDSISENKWPTTVSTTLGLTLSRNAVGGTKVADVSGTDTTAFCRDERINLFPTDLHVVLIMGGKNDETGTIMGDFSYPFVKSTFKGALAETIRKIQNRCPNAKIFVCSNIGGRGTEGVAGTVPTKNSINLTPFDYAMASKDCAEFMNVSYIDTWNCGISGFNRLKYIKDSVHPNDDGESLIAETVVNSLKHNEPMNV